MPEPFSYIIVCVAVAIGIAQLTKFLVERQGKRSAKGQNDQ